MRTENLGATALPNQQGTRGEDIAVTTWVPPVFRVSGAFSSHMVLQREKPIHVWGWSDTQGSVVTGTLDDETVQGEVGEDYTWHLYFAPRQASFDPRTMTIGDDRGNGVVFEDIWVGDVYFLGGQSNNAMPLSKAIAMTPDITFSPDAPYRLYLQNSGDCYEDKSMWNAPLRDVMKTHYAWERPTEELCLRFSAMGWYFAEYLSHEIHVPLGLVMMCAGGACLLDLAPATFAHKRGYDHGGMTKEGGLYNTLIHPWVGLSFRAQIFFQGESEGGDLPRANTYDKDLADFMREERELFGFDFPIHLVQLCSYRQEGAEFFPWLHTIRLKQFDALSLISDSTLTPSMDLESPPEYEDWAHSPKKREVAHRVARHVLYRHYGIGDLSHAAAPAPLSAERTNAQTVIVKLQYTGEGMTTTTGEVKGFSIQENGVDIPVEAHLAAPDTVVVSLPGESRPTHVAYTNFPVVTEENSTLRRMEDGCPLLAFCLAINNES